MFLLVLHLIVLFALTLALVVLIGMAKGLQV
jgi:hypothetical protein